MQWKSGDEQYDADSRQASTSDLSWNTPAELEKGTEYTFRVAAVNEVDNSGWSAESSGTPGTTPGTVRDFSVVAGEASGTLVLSWVAPEDDGGTPLTGYGIWWRTGFDAAETADLEDGSATAYTLTGLTTGVAYSVQIRAVNGAGNGAYVRADDASQRRVTPTTTVVSGSVRIALPTLDVDPAAFRTGREFASLSWRRPALQSNQRVARYEIQRRCGTDTFPTFHPGSPNPSGTTAAPNHPGAPDPATGTVTQIVDQTATRTTFVSLSTVAGADYSGLISGLTNGVECEFRVRAVTWLNVGNTALDTREPATESELVGAWITGKATPLGVPGVPRGVLTSTFTDPATAPVEVVAANKALHVSWSAPMTGTPPKVDDGGTAITGYKVSWDSNGPVGDATVAADVTSYVIPGLTNGLEYEVTIEAINARGMSDKTTAAPGTPAGVPGAPTGVTVTEPPAPAMGRTDLRGTQLIVAWSAPASNGTETVTGYVVQRRNSATTMPPAAAGAWGNAPGTAGNGNTFVARIDTGAGGTTDERGTSFDFRVLAVNAAGNGPWSDPGSGTAASLPSAVAQGNIDVQPGNGILTVAWTPPAANGAEITHYELRYTANSNTENAFWSTPQRVAASALPNFTFRPRSASEQYFIGIRAVNRHGESRWTNTPGSDQPGGSLLLPAPTTVTAEPDSTKDNTLGNMITVTWSAVRGARGYVIEHLTAKNQDGSAPDNPISGWVRQTPPSGDQVTLGIDNRVVAYHPEVERKVTIDLASGSTVDDVIAVRVRAVTHRVNAQGNASSPAMFGTPGFATPVKTAATPATAVTAVSAVQPDKTTILRVTWTAGTTTAEEDEKVTKYRITWYPTSASVRGNSGSAEVAVDAAKRYDITGLTAFGVPITIIVAPVNEIGDGAEPTSRTEGTLSRRA